MLSFVGALKQFKQQWWFCRRTNTYMNIRSSKVKYYQPALYTCMNMIGCYFSSLISLQIYLTQMTFWEKIICIKYMMTRKVQRIVCHFLWVGDSVSTVVPPRICTDVDTTTSIFSHTQESTQFDRLSSNPLCGLINIAEARRISPSFVIRGVAWYDIKYCCCGSPWVPAVGVVCMLFRQS